ncbi:DUF2235 domain-containing protein [Microvirga lotononidis]|uniref:T6SS Phospholipase effector Tle1-like catalytic domain-containing protein n=1 Tax=Microvirga lotononidis TaxID=864069 RepID=I4Z2L0_9HYPH|nr:DUF2235 domain-containing protein [Microvirga lotononidis]EIM30452.1 hypothetical protein MicloDRAFT_00007010 [Microvirga lotononidis]WQO26294.1 DUF2235 domain-containing protein [Microvirga lotononidis]
MKNVVVCCDGTANEFAGNKTNVLRTYSVIAQSDRQVAAYLPGIGTMEPPGALSDIGRRFVRFMARAVGYGLEHEIRKAYAYISRAYEPGDKLYLFGFSRGAYTVRAVASLLRMYGLLHRDAEDLVPYAIRYLMAASEDTSSFAKAFRTAADFKRTFSVGQCRPHFVGVWDTVSSVGWLANPLRLPFTAWNDEIEHGRHAISIDERRAFFRTNLWIQRAPVTRGDFVQVWFAGCHCDVGGGYPESEAGLSKIAFTWMLDEASALGLHVDKTKLAHELGGAPGRSKPDPDAKIHQSLDWRWWPAEFIPKSRYENGRIRYLMNLGARRRIPEGALIHHSVRDRKQYKPQLPTNFSWI